jgi:hypothetical protein
LAYVDSIFLDQSGQRHRDVGGDRQGFTWFHRFGLNRIQTTRTNTKFEPSQEPQQVGNACVKAERSAAGSSEWTVHIMFLKLFDVAQLRSASIASSP